MIEPEQTSVSIEQALGVVQRRAPWIVLGIVLVAAVAYGLSKHEIKKYTATAALSFNNSPLNAEIAGLSAGNSESALAQQSSNLELVKLGDTAAKTATSVGHGLTEQEVAASLSIGGQGESGVIDVSATSTSPVLAAAIANTYASQFVVQQKSTNSAYFKSALALVNRQLARLSPLQRIGSDGLDLQDRAHSLGLLEELGYNNAQVAQEALVPSSPSSPKTKRNVLLGAVVGLLLGLGSAFLLERMDRRIREPGDLETIYGLPELGVVPKSAALSQPTRRGGGGTVLPAAEAEAFSLIRAHLRFFNVDRDLRAVVIASPAPGDGKTTVARHLAEAAARSGSRVLLLEADLRQPTLALQLDIEPGPGLAGVLIGALLMPDATQSIPLEAAPGEGSSGRTLDVLVAGAVLPPNPGELLESRAMDVLLTQARSVYDLVVIDTPPLTAVSDAFPLLTKVDGVVIVGWLGRSRRDAAERLQQILGGSGAPLLGVIANGSKSNELTSYANPGSTPSPPESSSGGGASTSEDFVPATNS